MLHSFYNNTLKVKQEAQNIVLDSTIGNEIQLYKVGAKVLRDNNTLLIYF